MDSAVDNGSPETLVSAGPAVVSLDNRCEQCALGELCALGEAGDGRGLGEGVRVVPAERSLPEPAVP